MDSVNIYVTQSDFLPLEARNQVSAGRMGSAQAGFGSFPFRTNSWKTSELITNRRVVHSCGAFSSACFLFTTKHEDRSKANASRI